MNKFIGLIFWTIIGTFFLIAVCSGCDGTPESTIIECTTTERSILDETVYLKDQVSGMCFATLFTPVPCDQIKKNAKILVIGQK